MMEVFAGFLTHTDYQYGRLFDFLKSIGEWDNTLIMFISDNGASSEGGPHGSVNENMFFNNVPDTAEEGLKMIDELGGPNTFNHYPWGWTFAGNTPFRRWKRETYRGGISDPFIVHWPKGIKAKGEVRTQYAHAIDMVPTVLDALRHRAPARSAASRSRRSRASASPTRSTTRTRPASITPSTSRCSGTGRSITTAGARCARGPGPSFTESGLPFGAPIDAAKLTELDATGWELYNIDEDFAENHNVAARASRQTDRDDRPLVRRGGQVQRAADRQPRHAAFRRRAAARSRRTARATPYYPGTQTVPPNAVPKVLNRPHSDRGRRRHPARAAPKACCSPPAASTAALRSTSRTASCSYDYNYLTIQRFHVESKVAVPEGRHKLRFEFEPTGKPDIAVGKGAPGRAQLYVDGKLVGQTDLPVTIRS